MTAEFADSLVLLADESATPQPMLPGMRAGEKDGVYVCTVPLPDKTGELLVQGEPAIVLALFGDKPSEGAVSRESMARALGGTLKPAIRAIETVLPLAGAELAETADHKGYSMQPTTPVTDLASHNVVFVSSVESGLGTAHTGPIVIVSQEELAQRAKRSRLPGSQPSVHDLERLARIGQFGKPSRTGRRRTTKPSLRQN